MKLPPLFAAGKIWRGISAAEDQEISPSPSSDHGRSERPFRKSFQDIGFHPSRGDWI